MGKAFLYTTRIIDTVGRLSTGKLCKNRPWSEKYPNLLSSLKNYAKLSSPLGTNTNILGLLLAVNNII